MKKEMLFSLCLILVVFTAGCAGTGKKVNTNATAGKVISRQSGYGLAEAAKNKATKLFNDRLVSSRMDGKALAANSNHITTIKIVELTTKGIPDAVIISEIKKTGSVYALTPEITTYLKESGISYRIIRYMLSND